MIHGVEEASSFLLAKLIPKENTTDSDEETNFFNTTIPMKSMKEKSVGEN